MLITAAITAIINAIFLNWLKPHSTHFVAQFVIALQNWLDWGFSQWHCIPGDLVTKLENTRLPFPLHQTILLARAPCISLSLYYIIHRLLRITCKSYLFESMNFIYLILDW